MSHDHPQIPITLGPLDRMSEHGQQTLGLVLGAAGEGCMACAEDLLDELTEPAAVGRLVEITRRTVAQLNDGTLPGALTTGSPGDGEDFRLLVRTITEAADPAAAAAQMPTARRRAASRTAAAVLASYAHTSHQAARDRAAAGTPTLADACLAQARLMTTWWRHQDPESEVHEGWRRASGETDLRAADGEQGAVYLLGAVFHALAQEEGIRDDIHALPYTRALPLIRDREAVVRIVKKFVSPPAQETTGTAVKRLAIDEPDAPAFVVLRLWADLVCAAHAAACCYQGPDHECTLRDRQAFLAPYAHAAA
ncbi:hypothetical protein ACFYVL_09065 [Streptomyces sp. NPDC004111]|uniref:hypothetical protein n=1 Tax=Streptomyces sp. NPDC004111 TaxID=3364690 RepID=UPI0036787EFC